MTNKKFDHLVEELESQFHSIQDKIGKARDSYLSRHEIDFQKAKKKVNTLKDKLGKAKEKSAKAAVKAKKTGSEAARNQWKRTRAAAVLLGDSLVEAKGIMSTAEDKLKSAKPFDKKLAARAKALSAFEKEWTKKLKEEEKAKRKRAAERKAKAKEKAKAGAKPKSAVNTRKNETS